MEDINHNQNKSEFNSFKLNYKKQNTFSVNKSIENIICE